MPVASAQFADAKNGDDSQDGSRERPWKTIAHAVRQLKPGDTLCLRGGTYCETVSVKASGTAEKPITIRAHRDELVIIDAGYREFFEDPAHAWEPYPEGVEGEFRSTKSYPGGGGFGNFGDSMVPFHRYMTFADLRSRYEFWRPELENRSDDASGIYGGPGTRRDPETGRIHIRLAHTQLEGLGEHAYRGEQDPRKLPLVIARDGYAFTIENAAHVRIQDIVVRGSKTAAVKVENADSIALDGMTLYGGNMGVRASRVHGLRLIDCALRGHAAPWHSRFHHKNRAGSGYLMMAEGECTDLELTRCEFTDHHDFFAFAHVEGLRFDRNFVDNFNDDGLEPGPKRERGVTLIYQNLISRCLNPFTVHGKKANPVASEPGSGVYIYRNVIDLRRGTYKAPPAAPEPSGAFLNEPTASVAHDHGSPTHPVYYVYQNTFLTPAAGWRGYYALGLGAHTKGTTRRVFNNIFVQIEGEPGTNFTALSADDDFEADGNLFWSVRDGPQQAPDVFAKFRQSPLYQASKSRYAPGWGAGDRVADPNFFSLAPDARAPFDLRLAEGSAAIGSGIILPATWPDPLRPSSPTQPDIGAMPSGIEPWTVGVRGRIPLTGNDAAHANSLKARDN
jgi:hypothetical protein